MNHIVALSGGKDSTAMTLRLAEVEPWNDYEYVITPTGDELPEMTAHWKNLECLLGKSLTVITSGNSLQGLIRKQEALPNWRQRWCTRILKIEPYIAYMLKAAPAVSYVGLRADEESRQGAVYGNVEGITQRFPLQEWGWGLKEVQAYLAERGVTIPKRTDCGRCFFQRVGEWWTLWHEHPNVFAEAEANEAMTGHTFRSPTANLGNWPAPLAELRVEFEKGRLPRGSGQYELFSTDREGMCRACSL